LLVAPADVERAASLHQLREFQPLPRRALPFRSLVVASDDDPYLTIDRARELSLTWGSDLHVVSSGGHLNAASGLGGWPHGRALLSALVRATSLARAG
jgi:predicted alpha/beta hydrolase family esterase